jgi:DNA polymerase elongation subunit (family B)/predicted RNA-binding Zn-ribbon protein involved in translation (DUF1610 family)
MQYARGIGDERMSTAPKILTLDIETAPNLAYVWGLWDQTVSLSQLLESARVIAFAGKWHDKKTVHFYSEYHNGREAMIQAAHDMLSAADIVIHYNGKSFDMKHLRREFLLAKMPPPPPVQEIDLLSVVKNRFRFVSNKLEHIVDELGIGEKMKHEGMPLWVKCLMGDRASWDTMRMYNKKDVVITESLYDELRAWIPNHPNMLLFTDDMLSLACPRCASVDVQRRGVMRTLTRVSQRYQCQGCGSWFKSTRSDAGTTVRAAA